MGKKLMEYYEKVQKHGGVPAKMRLAMKTGIPSVKAAELPDSPELLEKFRAVVGEILGSSDFAHH